MLQPRKPSPTESPLLFEIDAEPLAETLTAWGAVQAMSRSIQTAINSVTYGNGTFVAVGSYENTNLGNFALTSANGSAWTTAKAAPSMQTLQGVAYGKGTYVAVGQNGTGGAAILTSTDGATWTTAPYALPMSQLTGVAFGNGAFMAVGASHSGTLPTILTSTDGSNWTEKTFPTAGGLNAVAYGKGSFVVVTSNGGVLNLR
ncbi:MAG: WD40/YVTN/BNR-like repeat-containing protein [Acidobacteriaceae bacterium]